VIEETRICVMSGRAGFAFAAMSSKIALRIAARSAPLGARAAAFPSGAKATHATTANATASRTRGRSSFGRGCFPLCRAGR